MRKREWNECFCTKEKCFASHNILQHTAKWRTLHTVPVWRPSSVAKKWTADTGTGVWMCLFVTMNDETREKFILLQIIPFFNLSSSTFVKLTWNGKTYYRNLMWVGKIFRKHLNLEVLRRWEWRLHHYLQSLAFLISKFKAPHDLHLPVCHLQQRTDIISGLSWLVISVVIPYHPPTDTHAYTNKYTQINMPEQRGTNK